MITIISGGKDSLKLIRALRNILYDDEITVIANTSDSYRSEGAVFSSDLDDIIFLFAGILNTRDWTGIKGDTYSTSNLLEKMGTAACGAKTPEQTDLLPLIPAGDKARALAISRAAHLKSGMTVTKSAAILSKAFGVRPRIIPASDTAHSASVSVSGCEMTIAEYRRAFKDEKYAEFKAETMIDCRRIPALSKTAKSAIESSDAVIIGPGSFSTTASPVLAVRTLRSMLSKKFTITVLPPLPPDYLPDKYPAFDKYLAVVRTFSNVIIQNASDDFRLSGTTPIDTTLNSPHKSESLAWDIMSVVQHK